MSQLETLAQPQHREAILLAEIAAWLHDDFKHTDQQIHKYVKDAPASSGRQDTGDLIPTRTLSFLGKHLDFATVKKRKEEDFIAGYLNRCHYAAHIEKEDGDGAQGYPAYLSSPFGFEISQIPNNLTDALRNSISWSIIAKTPFARNERSHFQKELLSLFNRVGGDTRRPANEITLWEWGHTVGALYKAALVGAFLRQVETPANDLRWRLLGIRTDGLYYLTTASRLPDLLARQRTLQIALDNVQSLLEETYPLATEVYRDENGALYVVPDIPNLLTDLRDAAGQTLLVHVSRQFDSVTEGEIVPEVTLDAEAWWGQDPDYLTRPSSQPPRDEIPRVSQILVPENAVRVRSEPQIIVGAWQNQSAEICPICRLRPCASIQVDYCSVCGERRQGRVSNWVKAQDNTIWLDEVADSNGRLALLTGTFDLTNWLNGKLVRTLLVRTPSVDSATKNPSFARLRRVWQTTRQFWQEVCPTDSEKGLKDSLVGQTVAQRPARLEVKGTLTSCGRNEKPGSYHTYDLKLSGDITLSVIWDPANDRFITCDNLDYLARPELLGRPVLDLLAQGKTITIEEPSGYGSRNQTWGTVTIDKAEKLESSAYVPAIPILAEPRTFMALVPADKALDILCAIKERYEREMGKVRNRLPLHVGVVYAHRRMPLQAILDAGRRMLQQQPLGGQEVWTVVDVAANGLPSNKRCLASGTQQFQRTVGVHLEQNGRSLTWYVPAFMGDGRTCDRWYPYTFFHADKDGNQEPGGRARAFKGARPTANGSEACWLVHAGDLQKGDRVYFTPATFDFEWLDSASRRFEIAYDERGRRFGRRNRPYLLDDLETIREAWSRIAGADGLTASQIHALREIIESRREMWRDSPQEETFQWLCRAAIRNAKWGEKLADHESDQLSGWASSGLLSDVIELYLEIMKRKPERGERVGVRP